MNYSEFITKNNQFAFKIIKDNEEKIKPQDVKITIFDNYLMIKFKKHKNKKLDYYSIYSWITNKDKNTIKLKYKSRKSNNYRLLTFLSENDLSADELSKQLLDHCQFIADITKERKK